jgi:hypothetical protein
VQFNPRAAVAPDVYVLPGVDPDGEVESWKVWETGVVPSFALEVVSLDVRKDYEESPRAYADFRVGELVIFDPKYETRRDRVRWQVYRRVARRGLVAVEVTNADRVYSRALGCWLRAVGRGGAMRVRLATGTRGEVLVPTAEEAERAERAAREAEHAARETERAAREAAEAEVVRLRRELRRLRARTKR